MSQVANNWDELLKPARNDWGAILGSDVSAANEAPAPQQVDAPRYVDFGGRKVSVDEIERVAQANQVSPETIQELGTWRGRLKSRVAKTLVGQTALRAAQGVQDAFGSLGSALTRAQVGLESLGPNPSKTPAENQQRLQQLVAQAPVVAQKVRQDKMQRQEFLSFVESGGAVDEWLGPKGSEIFNNVVGSVSKVAAGSVVAGPVGAYATIVGDTWESGLAEAEAAGKSGEDAVAFAGANAVIEGGMMALGGVLGRKLGLTTLEESLSRGGQQAVRAAMQRSGVNRFWRKAGLRGGSRAAASKATGAAGGAGIESVEEMATDFGQQLNELVAGMRDSLSWEQVLTAGITGAAAKGAVSGVQSTPAAIKAGVKLFKDLEQRVPRIMAGAKAAEEDLMTGALGEGAARAQTATPINVRNVRRAVELHNRRTIAEMTGEGRDFVDIQNAMLTQEQVEQAMVDYVEGGPTLNRKLRVGEDMTDANINTVVVLDRLFDTLATPTEELRQTYRGVMFATNEAVNQFLDGLRTGDVFSDPGYLSTSTNKSIADTFKGSRGDPRDVEFVVYGRSGVEVDNFYPGKTGESEILYPRNTNFRVKSVRRGKEGEPARVILEETSERFADAKVMPQSAEEQAVRRPRYLDRGAEDFARATGRVDTDEDFREGYRYAAEEFAGRGEPGTTSDATPQDRPVEGVQLVGDAPFVPAIVSPPAAPAGQGILWGNDGYVRVGDAFQSEVRGEAETVRRWWEQFTLDTGSMLKSLAERVPPEKRARATQIADRIVQSGERVISETRNIAGEIHDLTDKLLTRAGSVSFNGAAEFAHRDGVILDIESPVLPGVRAFESNLQLAMEGRLPLTDVPPDFAEFVRDYQRLVDERGKIAEREQVRQWVPTERQADRRAALELLTDAELDAEFAALMPNSDPALDRETKLDLMQSRQFFQNQGGNIFVRLPGRDGAAMTEGHPAWLPYQLAVMEMNQLSDVQAEEVMRSMFLTHEKKTAVEIPRILKRVPTAVEANGQRYEILSTHPFEHVQRSNDSFTKRLGNRRVFGDAMTQLDGVPVQDHLRDDAVLAGLDEATVDTYFNALSGQKIDRTSGDQGDSSSRQLGMTQAAINMLTVSKMSLAAIPNLFEPIANIRAFGGTKRLLEGYAIQMGRDPTNARVDARRAGAFSKEYADFTINRQAWSESVSRIYGRGVLKLFGVSAAWDQQAELGAIVGKLLADDFKGKAATKWDRDNLVRWLGYSEQQAEKFYQGAASDAEYVELMQRFASRSNSTKITNPAEESAIRGNPYWRMFMPLTRFSLLKTRDTANLVRGLRRDFREFRIRRDAESLEKVGRGLASTANYLAGAALSGAVANIVREIMFSGVEDGLALQMNKWQERPVTEAFNSLAAGQLGWFAGTVYWGATKENPLDAANYSVTAGAVAEGLQVLSGLAPYDNLSPTERMQKFIHRNLPVSRAGSTAAAYATEFNAVNRALAPMQIGQRDLKLEAAIKGWYAWRDRNNVGPGSGTPNDMTPADKRFHAEMRRFAEVAKGKDSQSPANLRRMSEHLANALGTMSKDPQQTAASIRGRKYLPQVSEDMRVKFLTENPEWYSRLSAFDDTMESWANSVYKAR